MKKTLAALLLFAIIMIGTTASISLSSTGMPGYTGSPGENSCNSCHSGGSASAHGITVTAVPSFSNDSYYADSTYKIMVQTNAGNFTRYGFACEILDMNASSTGTMSGAGPGVAITTFIGRRNAFHSTVKTGSSTATFTFNWKAAPVGDVTIYVAANAVNGNGNTSGDFPIPPIALTLTQAVAPEPPIDSTATNNLAEHVFELSQLSVFPNPSGQFTTISYFLKKSKYVEVVLTDIKGAHVKTLFSGEQHAGPQSQILDLGENPKGVYFIRATADNVKAGQKLVIVQ